MQRFTRGGRKKFLEQLALDLLVGGVPSDDIAHMGGEDREEVLVEFTKSIYDTIEEISGFTTVEVDDPDIDFNHEYSFTDTPFRGMLLLDNRDPTGSEFGGHMFYIQVDIDREVAFGTIWRYILSELQEKEEFDDYRISYGNIRLIDFLPLTSFKSSNVNGFLPVTTRLAGGSLAFHPFNIQRFDYAIKYGIKKLQMDDFSCIYESLMVILAQAKEPATLAQVHYNWISFVHQMFESEDKEFQQLIYEGKVYECTEIFVKKYGVNVAVVNIVFLNEYIEENKDNDLQSYFLLYKREHVIPYQMAGLQMLLKHVQKQRYDLSQPLKPFKFESMLAILEGLPEKKKIAYQMRNNLKVPDPAITIQQKINKYRKCGLCGIDVEVFIDNNMNIGNTQPYCLCIYGKLQTLHYDNIRAKYVRRLVDVDETFWGIDCVQKFMEFIIKNKFYQYKQKCKKSDRKVQEIRNFFFAHNGSRFDYRYMFEAFYQLASFQIIGSIANIKAFKGQGLSFFDTTLVLPQSLKKIAKEFFPNNPEKQKLKNETIKALDKVHYNNLTTQERQEISTYCRRDSQVVLYIAQDYFEHIFITPFNGSFVTHPFYYSGSQMAIHIWQKCFLTKTIVNCSKTYQPELDSYLGGDCTMYSPECGIGLSVDINSSYPAAMFNELPCDFPDTNDPIITLDKKQVIESASQLNEFYLYRVKYRFHEGVDKPCISQKIFGSLVMTSESGKNYLWVFGVNLKLAMKIGATIWYKAYIPYIGAYSHRDYIQYMYEQRQKNIDNPIFNKLYKNLMNVVYGKLGQKMFPKTIIGNKSYIYQWLEEAGMTGNIELDSLNVTQVPTNIDPMYQAKFKRKGQDKSSIGRCVRLASYITTIGRCNLANGMYEIGKIFGPQAVKYTDTDSIHIEIFPKNSVEYKHLVTDAQGKDIKQFIDDIKQAIYNDPRVIKLLALKTQDWCNVKSNVKVPMIDPNRLGSYKIENMFHSAYYLGSKQYMMNLLKLDKKQSNLTHAIKIRGIPESSRSYEQFQELVNKVFANQDNINLMPAQKYTIQTTFRSCISGVSIAPMTRFVSPTFTKRMYSIQDNISVPFLDPTQYKLNKMKQLVYISEGKKAERVRINEQEMDQRHMLNEQQMEADIHRKDTLKRCRLQSKSITELQPSNMRSFTMMRIPNVIFEDLPKIVVQIITDAKSEPSDLMTLKTCMQRTYLWVMKGIKDRNTDRRSPIKIQLYGSDEIIQIITYSLFTQKIIKDHGVLPLNMIDACNKLSNVVMCLDRPNLISPDEMNKQACKGWKREFTIMIQFFGCIINYNTKQSLKEFLQEEFSTESICMFNQVEEYQNIFAVEQDHKLREKKQTDKITVKFVGSVAQRRFRTRQDMLTVLNVHYQIGQQEFNQKYNNFKRQLNSCMSNQRMFIGVLRLMCSDQKLFINLYDFKDLQLTKDIQSKDLARGQFSTLIKLMQDIFIIKKHGISQFILSYKEQKGLIKNYGDINKNDYRDFQGIQMTGENAEGDQFGKIQILQWMNKPVKYPQRKPNVPDVVKQAIALHEEELKMEDDFYMGVIQEYDEEEDEDFEAACQRKMEMDDKRPLEHKFVSMAAIESDKEDSDDDMFEKKNMFNFFT